MLKTFPGPGYLRFEDGVVWLWHSLVNLYIWLTISSCYGSIPLVLGLMGRDGGLSTLCHSFGFACQQRVLKKIPGPGYLRSEDGVVWLRHSLVNLYIYIYIHIQRVMLTGLSWVPRKQRNEWMKWVLLDYRETEWNLGKKMLIRNNKIIFNTYLF